MSSNQNHKNQMVPIKPDTASPNPLLSNMKWNNGKVDVKIKKSRLSSYPPRKKDNMNMQLISKDSVLIQTQTLDDDIRALLKKLQGIYDPRERGWIMPKANFLIFREEIKKEREGIHIDVIPDSIAWILKPFGKVLKYREKREQIEINYLNDKPRRVEDLPFHLQSKLYDFQKKGIEFGLKNHGRVLIADEMGVGKTIQAISLAKLYEEDWPFLIVTPSSLRFNWKNEIRRWLDDLMERDIQMVTKSAMELRKDIKFIIMSYDIAVRMKEPLENYNFKASIFDEIHYLKNPNAKRTEILVPIVRKCRRILLLTGTPAFARPKELFNILNILRPDTFSDFKDFGARYCAPIPSKWAKGLDYDGASNTKELHFILEESIMIRRLKKDVLKELPPKRRQKIEVVVDTKIVNEIQMLLKVPNSSMHALFLGDVLSLTNNSSLNEVEDSVIQKNSSTKNNKDSDWALSMVTKCYALTGTAKIKGTQEYIKDIIQNDIKFIIFAHHIEMLNAIEDEVKSNKVGYIRIDGSVKFNKRDELIQDFQNNPDCKVAILSLTAASTGLNLTAASTVIFAEMHWTPAIMIQAEDRAHRIGQKEKNSVNCHYLYGEGTLDSLIYERLQEKLAIVSDMIDGKLMGMDVQELDAGKMGDINIWDNDAISKSKLNKMENELTDDLRMKEGKNEPLKGNLDSMCDDHQNKDNSKSGKILKNPIQMQPITNYIQGEKKEETHEEDDNLAIPATSIGQLTKDSESINIDEIDGIIIEEKEKKKTEQDYQINGRDDDELLKEKIPNPLDQQQEQQGTNIMIQNGGDIHLKRKPPNAIIEECEDDSEGFISGVDEFIEKEQKRLTNNGSIKSSLKNPLLAKNFILPSKSEEFDTSNTFKILNQTISYTPNQILNPLCVKKSESLDTQPSYHLNQGSSSGGKTINFVNNNDQPFGNIIPNQPLLNISKFNFAKDSEDIPNNEHSYTFMNPNIQAKINPEANKAHEDSLRIPQDFKRKRDDITPDLINDYGDDINNIHKKLKQNN